MQDFKSKIEANVADAFMKLGSLNYKGKEVLLVNLLGVTMQIRPNNQETEEFLITFRGQVNDGYGGFVESCYNCVVSAQFNGSRNVESMTLISVTNN